MGALLNFSAEGSGIDQREAPDFSVCLSRFRSSDGDERIVEMRRVAGIATETVTSQLCL